MEEVPLAKVQFCEFVTVRIDDDGEEDAVIDLARGDGNWHTVMQYEASLFSGLAGSMSSSLASLSLADLGNEDEEEGDDDEEEEEEEDTSSGSSDSSRDDDDTSSSVDSDGNQDDPSVSDEGADPLVEDRGLEEDVEEEAKRRAAAMQNGGRMAAQNAGRAARCSARAVSR